MAIPNFITSRAPAVLAGFLGTTAMTSTLWVERRARSHLQGPVDYDASSHVVQAASTFLHVHPDTDRATSCPVLVGALGLWVGCRRGVSRHTRRGG